MVPPDWSLNSIVVGGGTSSIGGDWTLDGSPDGERKGVPGGVLLGPGCFISSFG